jgi:HlyD family secretion protein
MPTLRKIAVAIFVVLLAGGTYAWYATRSSSPLKNAHSVTKVQRKDLLIKIIETGTLNARESHKLRVDVNHDVKIEEIVPEGTRVEAGDIVIKLSQREIEQDIERLTVECEGEEKAIRVAEGDLAVQTITNTNKIQKARSDKSLAEAGLEKYRELEGPKLSKEFSVKVADARSKWEDARKKLEELTEKKESELFSDETQEKQLSKEIEAAIHTLGSAQMSLDSAILDQKIFELYTYPAELTKRKVDLKTASIGLKQEHVIAEAALIAKETEVARKRSSLKQKQIQLKKACEDQAKLTLKAPATGLVAYGDPARMHYEQQNPIRVGGTYWQGMVLATIPDTSAFDVLLMIGEEYRSRLQEGQEATVTLDAVEGAVFTGEILSISNMATPRVRWDPESPKVYEVKVALSGSRPDITPGMTAKTEILVDRLQGVLTLPLDAVHYQEGKAFCFVDGDSPQRREIEVGPGTYDEVSIRSGLSEGERILLGKMHTEETFETE